MAEKSRRNIEASELEPILTNVQAAAVFVDGILASAMEDGSLEAMEYDPAREILYGILNKAAADLRTLMYCDPEEE